MPAAYERTGDSSVFRLCPSILRELGVVFAVEFSGNLFSPPSAANRWGRDIYHHRVAVLIRFAVPSTDQAAKVTTVVIVSA